MTGSHGGYGRFGRAVKFADANRLRYTTQQSNDGTLSVAHPVAPWLDAFATGETERVLQLLMDGHAQLVRQLTDLRLPRQKEVLRVVNDRIQALLGELELARATELVHSKERD